MVPVVHIQAGFAFFIFLHPIKDGILACQVQDRRIDVNDHITIHVTTVIASAIHVTTLEATVNIGRLTNTTCRQLGRSSDIVSCGCRNCVPFQLRQPIHSENIIAL